MRRSAAFLSVCTFTSVLLARPAAPIVGQDALRDAPVEAAETLIGRALFLRCFCAENNLSFDVQGHPASSPKVTDWTLAGVNVWKAERKNPNLIELQGVRIAVRFIPERREFERHLQTEEKLRIQVADTGDARQFQRALDAVFAQGIDPGLQRSMPAYWRHYFDPLLPWPADDLSSQTIYVPGQSGQSLSAAGMLPFSTDPKGPPVSAPVLTHRSEVSSAPAALKDRLRGNVLVRVVVDAQGVPRRVQISRPLGYGLDERAVAAIEKFRFRPGMRQGLPVASVLLISEDFPASEASLR